ncbi:MAG: M14 family metallopeptidase [bacterium]
MNKAYLFVLLIVSSFGIQAKSVQNYFSAENNYNSEIPTPNQVLGTSPGEWHYTPAQILHYMTELADSSSRIKLLRTGFSHEHKPLLLLIISSEENIQKIDKLRQAHLNGEKAPVVIWQAYSIHGNESSGSNAAVAYAWYLAAGESEQLKNQLKESIIVLDPMMNPDGLARAASWFNSHKGKNPVADFQSREHNEAWPNGRTNHYWFDLNRDWLLQVHPESQARLKYFYQWRPNVLTDHHEMGRNSSYFFQPGVPARQNPLTPDKNLTLTRDLARFHAKALDKAGQLYFSEESFDDYYYGKGSTYPDAVGSIGILFEQASARGHRMETDDGVRLFEQAIQNHVTTSLSTLEGSVKLKKQLIDYQQNFRAKINKSDKAWLVSNDSRAGVLLELEKFLSRHQIESKWLAKSISVDGVMYRAGESLIIPENQEQSVLIKALFERRTSFKDNTFYDVSTWNLPLSKDLPYTSIKLSKLEAGKSRTAENIQNNIDRQAIAWAIDWRDTQAPALLNQLLTAGAKVRVSAQSLTVTTEQKQRTMPAGTLIIPVALQDDKKTAIYKLLSESVVKVFNIDSGLTSKGPDLGSRTLHKLKKAVAAIIVGDGVNPYEAGEQWFHLDQQLGMEVSLLDKKDLDNIDFRAFTHLIWVDGKYKPGDELLSKFKQWVKNGGTLITQQKASLKIATPLLTKKEEPSKKKVKEEKPEQEPYASFDKQSAQRIIGGALLETHVDQTHPLAWGQSDTLLPVFKKGTVILPERKTAYGQVMFYTDKEDILLSGYLGELPKKALIKTPALTADRLGDGVVIRFGFDPLFRAYMDGTARLMNNALFFSTAINRTKLPEIKQK